MVSKIRNQEVTGRMKTLAFPMYTCREAEREAGIPRNTALYYIRTGQLRAVRGHDGWRVPYDALVEFVRMKEEKTARS